MPQVDWFKCCCLRFMVFVWYCSGFGLLALCKTLWLKYLGWFVAVGICRGNAFGGETSSLICRHSSMVNLGSTDYFVNCWRWFLDNWSRFLSSFSKRKAYCPLVSLWSSWCLKAELLFQFIRFEMKHFFGSIAVAASFVTLFVVYAAIGMESS